MSADENSFLTDKQVNILQKRKQGQTLDQIAKTLDTTRQNVSSIERSAEKNILRARKTLEIARLIDAPLWLSFDADVNLDSAISEIYKRSNEKGLHLPYDGFTIAELIKSKAPHKIKGRHILFKIDIGVTAKGEILVI